YCAEVVLGSLNGVRKGQWEPTTALSMLWLTKMWRIIWPQAWALMLPGFNNLAVMLVKGTAAVGLVLLNDITFEANQARITNGVWAAFGAALLIYLVIALIVSTLFRWMERRDRKSTRLNSSHVSISYAVFC